MAKESYTEKLLPKPGEDKAAYLQRIQASLTSEKESYDRALLKVSEAIAIAWNRLEGMENPFTAFAKDDSETAREMLDTAIYEMAREMQKNIAARDLLRDPAQKIADTVKREGLKGKEAERVIKSVTQSAKKMHDREVKEVLTLMKGLFDVVMTLPEPFDVAEGTPERDLLDELAPVYKDFKNIRRNITFRPRA